MTAEQHPAASPERGGTGRSLGARLAALSTPAPADTPKARAPRRARPAARKDAGKGASSPARPAPPAEQTTAPALYNERLSITTTIGQLQALRVARAQDGIQATARLRAMIALWQEDPKVRERVDRLARDWAG